MQPGGEPTRATEVFVGQSASGGGSGPYRKPPFRVRRSLLYLLLTLLVVAVVAVLVLVLLRPFKSAQASPAVGSSSPAPRASATSPSPSASTSPSPATSPGATPSPGTASSTIAAPGGGVGAAIANLSALTPLQENSVSSVSEGPEQIGATTYQDSVGFVCDTDGNNANLVYDVANYKFLSALIGVPSDASNAAGNAMTITFFKDGSTQLGNPVTISLDHPQNVHLNLQGASQLEIACNASNVTSQAPVYMSAALGNATIGPN